MIDPSVSIVILDWNGLEDTVECLESLRQIDYPSYRVIVVDNASAADEAANLRERFHDYVHVIRTDRNYGYTGGNNAGIRYALQAYDTAYVLVMNNDTKVAPDFLGHLVRTAESDPAIGIVGPLVYYHNPPDRVQSAGMSVNMWAGQATLIGGRQPDPGQHRQPREVDAVSGCCMLIKKQTIQRIGEFDEKYFCYWDETDYCTRARRAGLRVLCVPEARIWHKMPMKRGLRDRTPTAGRSAGFAQYCAARNRFRFMRRHASRLQYATFLVYSLTYDLWYMAALCLFYHRDARTLAGFLKGTLHGLIRPDTEPTFRPQA